MQKLVGAAGRLVAEHGRDSFSIQEITERADVGFGSVYTTSTPRSRSSELWRTRRTPYS